MRPANIASWVWAWDHHLPPGYSWNDGAHEKRFGLSSEAGNIYGDTPRQVVVAAWVSHHKTTGSGGALGTMRERAWMGVLSMMSIPTSMLTWGMSLALLWRWFAAPLGAPEMSIYTAVGIRLMVRCVTRSSHDGDAPDLSSEGIRKTSKSLMSSTFLGPAIVVGFGWLVVILWAG